MERFFCIIALRYNEQNSIHNSRFNGAGKTTASFTILPEILECKDFVNADESDSFVRTK